MLGKRTVLTLTVDFAGGTNFIVLAIITLAFSGHHDAREIVVSLFIMVWGARLSGFLLFRIISEICCLPIYSKTGSLIKDRNRKG